MTKYYNAPFAKRMTTSTTPSHIRMLAIQESFKGREYSFLQQGKINFHFGVRQCGQWCHKMISSANYYFVWMTSHKLYHWRVWSFSSHFPISCTWTKSLSKTWNASSSPSRHINDHISIRIFFHQIARVINQYKESFNNVKRIGVNDHHISLYIWVSVVINLQRIFDVLKFQQIWTLAFARGSSTHRYILYIDIWICLWANG